MHGGLLTDVVQSQPPAARVHGRPERQQNDLICMAADLPESVHAAAQIGYVRGCLPAGRSRSAISVRGGCAGAPPTRTSATECLAL